jgi:hypothetical protein
LREVVITDYFSQAKITKIACTYAIDALKLAPSQLDLNGPDMRSSVASAYDIGFFAFGGGNNDGRASAASRDVDYFGSASKSSKSRMGGSID